ncbi:hypothetical protein AB0F20_29715 [Streptomyces goshikiensis]|uniref:hypothetical protein n=1 Tax=Streptomyces goshikiensis TaxID=1942 RepID=UPI0033CA5DB7
MDPNPVPRQAWKLRKIHAELTDRGYLRVLVSPASVRLKTTEHPLHAHPYGADAPPLHPELLEEFVGLAPSGSRSLDEAIRAFYTAVGIPSRPLHPIPSPRVPSRFSPRAENAVRVLASGSDLASTRGRTVGWRVTADAVRLHVGLQGEDLSHGEVAELQLALAAWLRLNPAPGGAAVLPAEGQRRTVGPADGR